MGITDKIKSVAAGNDTVRRLLDTKKKKMAAAGIAVAVVVALAASIFFNMDRGDGYVTLFPGISKEENNEILAVLNNRGVEAKRNSDGEVTVPEKQFGDIMLDMTELGYPKTALPFDIFSDNMGFTTTEFEKRQYLLMNLQDRLERTLKEMNGVKNAIVTLNVSDESNYVWDDQASDSTASVTLMLLPAFEVSPDKVAAIKNLVSNSVPRLLPENVTVMNADTMEEMGSGELGGAAYGLNRLDFEAKVEEKLENKIKNVLALAYAPSQLRISATVVIDYDKMITEDFQYEPQENGQGVVEHFSESRSATGGTGAGGVAGEENNTDIPTYGAQAGPGGAVGSGDYSQNVDYLVGYIKKQIEKDNVKLQKATVAITVNDDNLTEVKREQLIAAASKAANIAPEDIVVSSFQQVEAAKKADDGSTVPVQGNVLEGIDIRILIAGVAAAVLLFLIMLFAVIRKRRKNHKEDQELFNSFEGAMEEEQDKFNQEATQEEIKHAIKNMPALQQSAPVMQIRAFADTNPEIIASMIRSWLKEET